MVLNFFYSTHRINVSMRQLGNGVNKWLAQLVKFHAKENQIKTELKYLFLKNDSPVDVLFYCSTTLNPSDCCLKQLLAMFLQKSTF